MKPYTTHLNTTANGRMVTRSVPTHVDRVQRARVGSEFFVGLGVAMPLALLLWAVVVWSIWRLMH